MFVNIEQLLLSREQAEKAKFSIALSSSGQARKLLRGARGVCSASFRRDFDSKGAEGKQRRTNRLWVTVTVVLCLTECIFTHSMNSQRAELLACGERLNTIRSLVSRVIPLGRYRYCRARTLLSRATSLVF